ncbi:MAG: hypothetical protein EXR98_20095 [Gemmataceae bacterium]|nr:hypothetical protein [Gemmataceae bacterium]
MTNPQTAAQDPAFWSHHCMIDKTWEDWLAQGGGRANPVAEMGWMNQEFEFYDENKKKVKIAVKDLLDTKKLGYSYGKAPPVIPGAFFRYTGQQGRAFNSNSRWLSGPVIMLRPEVFKDPPKKEEKKGVSTKDKKQRAVAEKEFDKPVVLEKKPFTATLKIQPEEKEKFAGLVRKEIPQFTFRLALDGATFGASPDPKHKKMVFADSWIEVFLNAPADAKLDAKSPYYLGEVFFFGPVHNRLAVTDLSFGMERHRKENRFKDTDELKITLVRVWGGDGAPAEIKTRLTFKKIRLLVLE